MRGRQPMESSALGSATSLMRNCECQISHRCMPGSCYHIVFRGRFIVSILLCDLVCFHYQQFNLPVQRDCRIMNITNKIHKSKNIFDMYIYICVSFHSFPVLVGPPAISSKTRQALMLPVRQLIIKGVRPSPQKTERRHAILNLQALQLALQDYADYALKSMMYKRTWQ